MDRQKFLSKPLPLLWKGSSKKDVQLHCSSIAQQFKYGLGELQVDFIQLHSYISTWHKSWLAKSCFCRFNFFSRLRNKMQTTTPHFPWPFSNVKWTLQIRRLPHMCDLVPSRQQVNLEFFLKLKCLVQKKYFFSNLVLSNFSDYRG